MVFASMSNFLFRYSPQYKPVVARGAQPRGAGSPPASLWSVCRLELTHRTGSSPSGGNGHLRPPPDMSLQECSETL